MKKRDGFTLIELLVVMVIIAVLAGLLMPAIRKGRAKALVSKAEAEMAGLASIMTMVKLDTGFYVRLRDLATTNLSGTYTSTNPYYGSNWGGGGSNTKTGVFAYFDPSTLNDTTDCESELTSGHHWAGPYQVFQSKATYQAGQGSLPDAGGTGWNVNGIPYGTPLDPWGRPYLVAYNTSLKILIIYSAGPNGKIETAAGAILVGDGNGDGDLEDPEDTKNSDDNLYQFR